MTDIQTKATQQALRLLNALGAKYKIILPDATEYGELIVAKEEPKKMRRKLRYPRGTFSSFLAPMFEHTKVGDVVQIPIGEFKPEHLRSAATAYTNHLWGPGSATSSVTKQHIEVMRLA